MLAEVYTLETTYQLQLRSIVDGTWNWTSQVEYTSRDDCERLVAEMYGGAFSGPGQYRVIRHERHIEE